MADRKKQKMPGRFQLSGLLVVLLLAFVLSSGVMGFQLGRSAARSSGKLVDTIVLSPGDSVYRRQEVLHFLKGKLQLRSGAACAGMTVTLGDASRSDVTDEHGNFYFTDVRSESYALSVSDEQGNAVGETQLKLDFSTGKEISADGGSFSMPEDARLLEVTLTVEDDKTVTVEQDGACFVTRDGQIVNFDGAAIKLEDDEQAVTPGGNLVNSWGYVLLPSEQIVFTPQGEQITTEVGSETLAGTVVEEDGSVDMEEGTVILPGGGVELPTGEIIGGDKFVIITDDGETDEMEQLPDSYAPPQPQPEQTPAQDEPISSQPQPTPTPAPVDNVGLIISDGEVIWQQESIIDLFAREKKVSGITGKSEDLEYAAAPGSKGYYDFCVKNDKDYDILYTFEFCEPDYEGALHLPIRYSLVNSQTNESYLYRERIGSLNLYSETFRITAGSEQYYRIDWEWEYEDWFRPERDDAIDTAAAQSGKDYVVYIRVNAAMTAPQPSTPWEGDTRYPGVK